MGRTGRGCCYESRQAPKVPTAPQTIIRNPVRFFASTIVHWHPKRYQQIQHLLWGIMRGAKRPTEIEKNL